MTWFTLYIFLCIVIGAVKGWHTWPIVPGIFGGAFLGLLIGIALFYCFAILLSAFPRKKRVPENEENLESNSEAP